MVFLLIAIVALASGCATTPTALPVASQSNAFGPAQAVRLATAFTPREIPGVFEMRVTSTGAKDRYTYLNSEANYRSKRCLTIAISPSASHQLTTMLGKPPAVAFKGKHILVTGAAVRVKVYLMLRGIRVNKFYYQTHVQVTDPKQIEIRADI